MASKLILSASPGILNSNAKIVEIIVARQFMYIEMRMSAGNSGRLALIVIACSERQSGSIQALWAMLC
jgi:hypothetical protein